MSFATPKRSKHEQVQPGDMRFYTTRTLTIKKLGHHTPAEWTVLAAEVEAIHGKRFEDTAWLQQYFDERYWYRAADKYDPKSLTEIERKNLQLIESVRKTTASRRSFAGRHGTVRKQTDLRGDAARRESA